MHILGVLPDGFETPMSYIHRSHEDTRPVFASLLEEKWSKKIAIDQNLQFV